MTGAASSPRVPRETSNGASPARTSGCAADAASLEAAAQALREGTRDDEELVLRVPTADGIASLRDVLARLGDGMAVEDLSIAQLVATSVGVSSPAWDRLTEIAKEHMTGR